MKYYALVEGGEIKRINISLPFVAGNTVVGKSEPTPQQYNLFPIIDLPPAFDMETQICSTAGYEFDGIAVNKTYVVSDVDFDTMSNDVVHKANVAASKMLEDIIQGYPECEVKSWTQQNIEAEAWLTDKSASTPLLDALANKRDMDKLVLSNKVVAKASSYAMYTGSVVGARQRVEDMVEASTTIAELLAIPTVEQIIAEA